MCEHYTQVYFAIPAKRGRGKRKLMCQNSQMLLSLSSKLKHILVRKWFPIQSKQTIKSQSCEDICKVFLINLILEKKVILPGIILEGRKEFQDKNSMCSNYGVCFALPALHDITLTLCYPTSIIP